MNNYREKKYSAYIDDWLREKLSRKYIVASDDLILRITPVLSLAERVAQLI
jgi:hypothetical protein